MCIYEVVAAWSLQLLQPWWCSVEMRRGGGCDGDGGCCDMMAAV
ncbi:hypothetical protein Tco_0320270, partial [Tanacetum coccineum]